MDKKMYSYADIKEFLLDKDILWSGEAKKVTQSAYCEEIVIDALYAQDKFSQEVIIEVSPTNFIIFQELPEDYYEDYGTIINELADYSIDWMALLIKKSPENARVIKQKAQEKLSTINEKFESELRGIEAQKSLAIGTHKREITPWQSAIDMANKVLPQDADSSESEPENE